MNGVRVIHAEVLFEILDAYGHLTADDKLRLVSQFDGRLVEMKYSGRVFAMRSMKLADDDPLRACYLPAIDTATEKIVGALSGTGPETVPEFVEWQTPAGSVGKYWLEPHAQFLRLVFDHSFEIAALQVSA